MMSPCWVFPESFGSSCSVTAFFGSVSPYWAFHDLMNWSLSGCFLAAAVQQFLGHPPALLTPCYMERTLDGCLPRPRRIHQHLCRRISEKDIMKTSRHHLQNENLSKVKILVRTEHISLRIMHNIAENVANLPIYTGNFFSI